MTNQRYWGNLAGLFLVGANVALVMSLLRYQYEPAWMLAANCLTLCVVMCLFFRQESRIEAIAQVCDGLKILVLSHLKKAPPLVCKPPKSELKESASKFPKQRGD